MNQPAPPDTEDKEEALLEALALRVASNRMALIRRQKGHQGQRGTLKSL
jgi:hypothetical protein